MKEEIWKKILFTEIKERALVRTKTRGKDGRYSAKKTEQLSWRGYVHFFLINIRYKLTAAKRLTRNQLHLSRIASDIMEFCPIQGELLSNLQ